MAEFHADRERTATFRPPRSRAYEGKLSIKRQPKKGTLFQDPWNKVPFFRSGPGEGFR
jgi:hypothetical protein